MPLSLTKTWQLSVNQTVTAQGSGVATERRLLRTIKNLMIGFANSPWSVRGSSNGTTAGMDQVDRWSSDGDIVKNSAGSAHSWIVLRQTGIGTNFEACIDMNSGSTGLASVIVSPSAGFTGGSTTARPTATDESVLISSSQWSSAVDAQHQIHAMQSTDGACFLLFVYRNTTNMCTCWVFQKPATLRVSGWTTPAISFAAGSTSTIAANASSLASGSGTSGRLGSVNFAARWTGEGISGANALYALTGLADQANDFDSSWIVSPIGIASTTLNARGAPCALTDIWWAPTGLADGDTFPNSATNKRFLKLGPFVVPWTNDSTSPLLV